MSRGLRVTLFDYGAGNLHSLGKALAVPGVAVVVETDPLAALDTDLLVLPGVGNFTVAAEKLAPARAEMLDAISRGLPTLGVCLGMQLLFDDSDEGPGLGLGVIAGRVTRLNTKRIPQIGWNAIEEVAQGELCGFDDPIRDAYFANSFACRPTNESAVIAWSTHESDRFAAAVRIGNALGVQFHPEKSSTPGVRFLRALVESVRAARPTVTVGGP